MAQYVFTMNRVGKMVPPKRQILKDISLSFFPGAKIGVLGVNGSGKSSLLKIMAGLDDGYSGEARLTPGFTVGYLAQEPQLDPNKDVKGNVMDGVAAVQGLIDRYNEVMAMWADPDADYDKIGKEQARLEDKIAATDAWSLDRNVEIAMDALRCPPDDADVTKLSGGERRRLEITRALVTQRISPLVVQGAPGQLSQPRGVAVDVARHDDLPAGQHRLELAVRNGFRKCLVENALEQPKQQKKHHRQKPDLAAPRGGRATIGSAPGRLVPAGRIRHLPAVRRRRLVVRRFTHSRPFGFTMIRGGSRHLDQHSTVWRSWKNKPPPRRKFSRDPERSHTQDIQYEMQIQDVYADGRVTNLWAVHRGPRPGPVDNEKGRRAVALVASCGAITLIATTRCNFSSNARRTTTSPPSRAGSNTWAPARPRVRRTPRRARARRCSSRCSAARAPAAWPGSSRRSWRDDWA